MKEITSKKEELLVKFAKELCKLDDPSDCGKEYCRCRLMAEVRALMQVVLPDGFDRFTIKHFDGQDDDKNIILQPSVARRAKEQVIRYCWDIDPTQISQMSLLELANKSIMAKRIANAQNIVIHGESIHKPIIDEHGERVGLEDLPSGRTFVASILTREAILLRAQGHPELLYDWIEFGAMLEMLAKDEGAASNYETCDWLVVDNITDNLFRASNSAKAFAQSKYDAFFYSRIAQGLPTVLVFKFDVDAKRHMIEDSFGPAVYSIVTNKKTCVISLSGKGG